MFRRQSAQEKAEFQKHELFEAVVNKDTTKVKQLLDSGSPVDFKVPPEWRKPFLSKPGFPYVPSKDWGDIPLLHLAAMVGNIEVMGALLNKNPEQISVVHDLSQVKDSGYKLSGSILHNLLYSQSADRVYMFKHLVRSGADLNAVNSRSISVVTALTAKESTRSYPLAVEYNEKLDLLTFCVEGKAVFNALDIANMLQLIAVGYHSENSTQYMLAKCDIDLLFACMRIGLNFTGAIATAFANLKVCADQKLRIAPKVLGLVRFLVEKDVSLSQKDIECMLDFMGLNPISSRDVDLLKLCYKNGLELNGRNLLHYIAKQKIFDDMNVGLFIGILIESGMDLNIQDSDGRTPLSIAVSNEQSVVATELLNQTNANGKLQVDIELADNQGMTPLHHAVEFAENVQILLEHGANKDAVAANGRTVAHYAANHASLKELIEHGAKIDQADAQGITPLMLAVKAKKLLNVSALLTAGADVSKTDNEGNSALHYALVDPQIHKLLEQELLRQHREYKISHNAVTVKNCSTANESVSTLCMVM